MEVVEYQMCRNCLKFPVSAFLWMETWSHTDLVLGSFFWQLSSPLPPVIRWSMIPWQARGNQWWNFTKLTDKYTKLASRGLFILNEAKISWTYCNIVVTLIIIINLSIQVICRCPLLPRLPCLSTDFDDILQLSCQMFRQTQPAASQTIITITDSNHTFGYFQHIVAL